jgi:hypothetical protein
VKTNTTATINTQAAAIGTLQGQIVGLNANADAAFYALLTADQKAKLDTLGSDFFGEGLGDIHIPWRRPLNRLNKSAVASVS